MTLSRSISVLSTVALLLAGMISIGCESKKEPSPGTPAPAVETKTAKPVVAATLRGTPVSMVKVAAPLYPKSTEIAGYLTLSSLDAALKGFAEIAAVVDPSEKAPTSEDMKGDLGAMLGDPQLSGVDGSKPIAIALLGPADPAGPPMPRIVGLVPAKQATPYDQSLLALGMESRFADGLLEIALTPGSLEAAATARSLHSTIVKSKLNKTARLHLNTTSILESFGPMLRQYVAMIPMMIGSMGEGSEGLAKILKAELLGLVAILEQGHAIELDVNLGGDGVGIDTRIAAKPGSEFAKLFTASKAMRPPATAPFESNTAFAMSFAIDAPAMGTVTNSILAGLAKDPEFANLIRTDFRAIMKDWSENWAGTGLFSMQPNDKNLGLNYAIGTNNPDKFVQLMESAGKLLAPDTELWKL
jgi:hypothetical protein